LGLGSGLVPEPVAPVWAREPRLGPARLRRGSESAQEQPPAPRREQLGPEQALVRLKKGPWKQSRAACFRPGRVVC